MEVVEPDKGYLACGDIGEGKMPSEQVLLEHILRQINYEKDLAGYAKINVAALVKRSLKKNTDIRSTIQEYFVAASDNTVNNIAEMAKGGRLV